MDMELYMVINARQVIDGLAEKENIGSHLSYWLTKFVVKTEKEQEFYADKMRAILDKYAHKNDEGKMVVDQENIDNFNAEVKELEHTDVEEPGIRFALSELSTELKLSMKQMYPLLEFIDEDK